MAEHATAHDPATAHDEHGTAAPHDHRRDYFKIFWVLTVLTGVEVGITYMKLPKSVMATLLVGLATTKAAYVALYFMHLKYEKRSLLSVVKKVKTPTMVLTGEADYRTPMSDSEQYYQALKLLGVESVLVRVPDEPHGISVRPSHHMSKILHIIAWFDRHRRPPEQKAQR